MTSIRSTKFGQKVIEKLAPFLVNGEIDQKIEEIAETSLAHHFNSSIIAEPVLKYVVAVKNYEKGGRKWVHARYLDNPVMSEKMQAIYAVEYKLTSDQDNEAADVWLSSTDCWQAADKYFAFLEKKKKYSTGVLTEKADTQVSEESVATKVADKILLRLRSEYPKCVITNELSLESEEKTRGLDQTTSKLLKKFPPKDDLLDTQSEASIAPETTETILLQGNPKTQSSSNSSSNEPLRSSTIKMNRA